MEVFNIDSIEKDHFENFKDLADWSNERYQTIFSKYFEPQREIQKDLMKNSKAISNESLERVLIDVPLLLMDASESVNQYKLRIESIKLGIKAHKISDDSDAELSILKDKLLIAAYEFLIARVEKEMSYSREFIMGAKKIWDGRRAGQSIMPVSPIDEEDPLAGLPEYNSPTPKTYIR